MLKEHICRDPGSMPPDRCRNFGGNVLKYVSIDLVVVGQSGI
jgi:hypothetical protein